MCRFGKQEPLHFDFLVIESFFGNIHFTDAPPFKNNSDRRSKNFLSSVQVQNLGNIFQENFDFSPLKLHVIAHA